MATKPKYYSPKTPRKMNDELMDILVMKALQINPKGLLEAIAARDGNALVDICGDVCVALKIREKTNKNDGYMVELIQKVSGGKKGWAWCMYMMQVCVAFAERLLNEVSEFPLSGSCAAVRNAVKKKYPHLMVKLIDSLPGDIWILVNGDGSGHTGEFTGWEVKGKVANLNEGNTTKGSIAGKIVREGGGAYFTQRPYPGPWVMAIRPFPTVKDVPAKPSIPVVKSKYPAFGEISDRVMSMQRAMNNHGAKLKCTGYFGKDTKAALSKIQKANGLPGTGIPAVKTMAILGIAA